MSAASFTLVIPVLNEESTLDSVLDRVLALPFIDELIVVNDGSTDRTGEVLRRRLDRSEGKRLRVITHRHRQGKGAAIRSAISEARTQFLSIQDADLEYDPAEQEKLLELVLSRACDVAYGSRFLQSNPNIYPMYRLGNQLLTAFANALGGRPGGDGKPLTDSYTCYKLMSVERWRALRLESEGFEIEAEITMKALVAGWRVHELPIRYEPRTFEQGKKIRAKDALKGVLTMLRCRFGARPPRFT